MLHYIKFFNVLICQHPHAGISDQDYFHEKSYDAYTDIRVLAGYYGNITYVRL